MSEIGILGLTGCRSPFAIVDADILPELNKSKWHETTHGYIATSVYDPNTQKTTPAYLHRIVNATPRGLDTDHVNGFKLDNRRSNLRTATTSQNVSNRRNLKRKSSSKFKGVCWTNICSNHWQAYISVNGKRIHLKRFKTEKEAAEAYNVAAKQHFGEFACLNAINI